MLVNEARWICSAIKRLGLKDGAVCLNIGSSTRAFREEQQPHISGEMIQPLEKGGLRFVHCDMKMAEGVDIVADVMSDEGLRVLQAQSANLLLASNLLEHLTDPKAFCAQLHRVLPIGGYAVVSVPYSFPLHRDPIDTMFRPSPEEIAALFPGFRMVDSAIVEDGNFLEEIRAQPRPALRLAKHLVQCLMPFYRRRKWQERVHALLWLWRPYAVSIAILQVER